jgi:hypothetical protein
MALWRCGTLPPARWCAKAHPVSAPTRAWVGGFVLVRNKRAWFGTVKGPELQRATTSPDRWRCARAWWRVLPEVVGHGLDLSRPPSILCLFGLAHTLCLERMRAHVLPAKAGQTRSCSILGPPLYLLSQTMCRQNWACTTGRLACSTRSPRARSHRCTARRWPPRRPR